MSPAAILERVDERFRLLGHGRRTARRRHQTFRAAVDWSYGLLGPQEQTVFERLSVFAGEFTLEAAEAVVADDRVDPLDLLDLVADLVAKSMVQVDEGRRRRPLPAARDHARLRAGALAARGDLDRFRQHHAGYYLDLGEAAAPHFVGGDDTEWLRRVDEEYPNIRAALLFTQEHAPSDFVRMVFALARFWPAEGRFREGLAWITAAHAAAPDVPGPAAADALAIAGQMAINLARWDEGFDLVQRSLDRSDADGEPARALALTALALAALVQTRPEDARRFSEEALTLARARGEPYELAETLSQAGLTISLTSDDPRGVALADESVDVARSLGNHTVLSTALEATGMTRYRTDPARAIVLIQEGFDLRSARDNPGASQAHFMKAIAHLALRDDQRAAAALLDALPRLRELGQDYYEAMALAGAAVLLRRRGRPDIAVSILALNARLRDEGRILGAARDLESQDQLKERLEREIEPELFARLWADGRGMSLDDAITLALDELAVIAEGG